jgi:hypothetical protein
MLSRCTTGVLAFFNFFVGVSLVIAAFLPIRSFLLIGPFFIVQAFLFVCPVPVCVLPRISGLTGRAWLSLRTRWSLYCGSRWGGSAPGNE